MSGFKVGRQAQMIPVLHSMADQDAAPTLSSGKTVSRRSLGILLERGFLLTGRIHGIGYLLETDETNDAGNAHTRQSVLTVHSIFHKYV